MLNEVKRRAIQVLQTIESRKQVIRDIPDEVEIFKSCRYIDDRNLQDYCNCLPNLHTYLKKNINVLDVGCGKGTALKDIKNIYSCNVVGVTMDKLFKSDFPVFYSTADELPFDDNTFDVVMSVHGISWEPNQRKAISELVRVLKPGGTAHIYLIKFSHSIALFIGTEFWNGIDREKYETFEFSPDIHIEDVDLSIKELEFPKEECEGYYKEWQLLIKK